MQQYARVHIAAKARSRIIVELTESTTADGRVNGSGRRITRGRVSIVRRRTTRA